MDEFTPCFVCDRLPLVGESVSVMGDGEREYLVCDHCAANPRAIALGEVIRRDRIHSAEGAENVHRTYPQPTRVTAPEPSRSTAAV